MSPALSKWIVRLERYSGRWWYFPLIAFLAALDLVILIIPTDGLLISSVMLQPKKWVRAFIWVSLGSALGSVLVQVSVDVFGPIVVGDWMGVDMASESFKELEVFIDKWGELGMAAMAFGPLPLAPAVVVAALGKMGIASLFFWILLGRLVKYAIFAWAATYAPDYLKKLWGVSGSLNEILEASEKLDAQGKSKKVPQPPKKVPES